MTSVSEGSNWSQQFGYDAYGNRWVSSSSLPLSSLTPQAQTGYNAATNQLTPGLFQYDASGNQTLISPWQIAYDGENRQVSVKNTGTGAVTQYTYDGDGHRVTKVDGGQTTVYIYDGAGALAAEYGDQAQTPVCGTCFLTVDQLGSTRVVMDESGNVKARDDYLPWGEELYTVSRTSALGYQANDGVTQKFTSKERDAETGLDYFGARYYGSALGRFTSPDPIGGHYTDPQTLNRYSYVRNNPLRFVDPDGLDLRASCDQESDMCHKAHWWSGRYEGTWDQDHKHFTVTRFQTDSSGNLAGHTINFDASGIHIDGHQGSFIEGTDPTRVNGTGAFSDTHFVANSDCLGTCVAGGGLFANDGGAFLGFGAFGLKGPNLGIDRFGEHPGDQYRGGNTNGPDAHLSFVPGATELPLHFDTRFPYGSISGFAVHTGDLFYHDFQTRVLRRQDTQLPDDIKPAQSVPQP